jgi:hypothetical protein
LRRSAGATRQLQHIFKASPDEMYNAHFNKSLKIMGFAGLLLGSVATIVYVIHNIISHTPARDYATLIPASDPMPEHWCNEKAGNRFRVYFGDYLVVINGFPNRVLSITNEDMLIIDKDKAGNIIIKLLTVFDGNQLIAKVDESSWQVASFKKTEDRSTLIVYDHLGDEYLRLIFLNQNAIKLSGIFQHPKSQTKVVMRTGGQLNLPGTQPYSNCSINNSKYAVDFNFP